MSALCFNRSETCTVKLRRSCAVPTSSGGLQNPEEYPAGNNVIKLNVCYLPNGKMYWYISCTLLKPIYYNLASDFITRSRHCTHTSATWKTQTPVLFLKKTSETGTRVSPVFVSVHQVAKVLIGRHPWSIFKQVEIVVLLYKHDV
jgi:hypothetical protein